MGSMKSDISIATLGAWIRQYIVALRVLSLTLALGATNLGILAAVRAGLADPTTGDFWLLVGLVTVAGLAAQAGANLINDYFEGSFKYVDPSVTRIRFLGRDRTVFDVVVFLSGLAALGLAGLIGLYLVWRTDWIMCAIGLVGLVGSYAYTGEPFVYKTKGLGVVLSFILMGPLMSLGAWYPFAGTLSWYPVLVGLPIALLVPALMISNEMRDYRRDRRLTMGTLSTRIGRTASIRLYDVLVFGSFVLILAYVFGGVYPWPTLAVLLLFPMAVKARTCVVGLAPGSIPWTNRLHLGYLAILTLSLGLVTA